MPSKQKILIVDDHAVFRDGLAMILEKTGDLMVCAQCDDAADAVKQAALHKPDMAIVDISLEGTDGIELTKTLRVKFPKLQILVLSMHKESLYADRALRAGANGYIMKQERGRTLLDAIRHVMKGGTYVSDAVKEWMLQNVRSPEGRESASPVGKLSDRELEIFQLIAKGYGTRQIAETLNLSTRTVETHREHIREKMDLKNGFELVRYAIQWSLGSTEGPHP